MSIELSEATIGIWWVGNCQQDVLAHLSQSEGDTPTLVIRLRNCVDDKIWDSDDEKSWHTIKPGPNYNPDTVLQEMIDKTQGVIDELAGDFGCEPKMVMMGNGGLSDFIERFTALPCIHTKTMSKEEYESEYGKETKH